MHLGAVDGVLHAARCALADAAAAIDAGRLARRRRGAGRAARPPGGGRGGRGGPRPGPPTGSAPARSPPRRTTYAGSSTSSSTCASGTPSATRPPSAACCSTTRTRRGDGPRGRGRRLPARRGGHAGRGVVARPRRATRCRTSTSPASVDRLVVVGAHPDDETLGAGGLVHLAGRSGWEVLVVSATAGEGSHPASPTHDPGRAGDPAPRRARAGGRRCSPASAEVVCLGHPDGSLADLEEALVAAIVAAVGLAGERTLLAAPWRHDGHPDHEAVGRAAAVAARRTDARLVEYPVWMWHWGTEQDLPWPDARVVRLDDTARAAKRAAVAAHASQVAPLSEPARRRGAARTGAARALRPRRGGPPRGARTGRRRRAGPGAPRPRRPVGRGRLVRAAQARDHPGQPAARALRTGARGRLLGGGAGRRPRRALRRPAWPSTPARPRSAAARTPAGRASTTSTYAAPRSRRSGPRAASTWCRCRRSATSSAPRALGELVSRALGSLAPDGHLLLCHWRHDLVGWPLTGPAGPRRLPRDRGAGAGRAPRPRLRPPRARAGRRDRAPTRAGRRRARPATRSGCCRRASTPWTGPRAELSRARPGDRLPGPRGPRLLRRRHRRGRRRSSPASPRCRWRRARSGPPGPRASRPPPGGRGGADPAPRLDRQHRRGHRRAPALADRAGRASRPTGTPWSSAPCCRTPATSPTTSTRCGVSGTRSGDGHEHVHGANLGFTLAAYRAVGGFPHLPVHEDVELVRALRRLGRPVDRRRGTGGRHLGAPDGPRAARLRGVPRRPRGVTRPGDRLRHEHPHRYDREVAVGQRRAEGTVAEVHHDRSPARPRARRSPATGATTTRRT